MMRDAERTTLVDLRHALVALHRTLLEWERAAYERAYGRLGAAELLSVIVTDQQFAWLRPMSELIARIDGAIDGEAPDTAFDLEPVLTQARLLVQPDEAGTLYARRYHQALQELPDAVFAHRRVMAVLKDAPATGTLH